MNVEGALDLAGLHNFGSVAFPILGSGSGRFLSELVIFLLIAAVAVLVGAASVWAMGIPLELDLSKSIALSAIGLVFVFPSAVNIWIMLRGPDNENRGQRLCAGIRGFGMLLCGVALALPFVVAGAEFKHAAWLLAIGSILWWGSVPFERRFAK